MFIDLILLWLVNLFCPNKEERHSDTEDGAAFFFGSAQFDREKEGKSEPVNEDYDNGPDWG